MSSSEPTPTAPDGSAVPSRTPDFAAPAAYPAAPTPRPVPSPAGYPSPAASPQPGNASPGYAAPGAYGPQVMPAPGVPPTPQAPAPWASSAPRERVGRGLLFSLGGIVVGVVLTVVLWKLNFIASITSFAMAYSAIWLYAKGAGRGPAKGAAGVISVIALGVVACLASLVVADALTALAAYPEIQGAEKAQLVVAALLDPSVWGDYTREVLMYLLFAALGTFGLIRQLGRARRA